MNWQNMFEYNTRALWLKVEVVEQSYAIPDLAMSLLSSSDRENADSCVSRESSRDRENSAVPPNLLVKK